MSNTAQVDVVVAGVSCTGTVENDHIVISAGMNVVPGQTIVVDKKCHNVTSAVHNRVDSVEHSISIYMLLSTEITFSVCDRAIWVQAHQLPFLPERMSMKATASRLMESPVK